jgi:protein-S-isoprenylcysteine O-methyltransferase Ste14
VSEPNATPWVFRHRVWVIAAAFLGSALLANAVSRAVRVPFGEVLALDPRLQLGSRLPFEGAPVAQVIAPTLLILAGMALRTWGTSYLRGHVMLDRRLHTDRLIVAGPFRWCRNPLYLGNVLFAAGFGLYLPPPGLLFAVAGMGIAVGFIAVAEAKALRKAYGTEYHDYARKVPMFLPRPPRRDLPGGTPVEPDWANGLKAELWQLVLAGYLACVALRQTAAALVLAAVAFVGVVLVRRRARPNRDSGDAGERRVP